MYIRLLSTTLLLLTTACAGARQSADTASPSRSTGDYRQCDEQTPCAAAEVCTFGLCLSQCGDSGEACTEGAVCVDGACTDACGPTVACDPGFSCIEGSCSTDPCAHPDFWPLSIASESLPFVVHFRHEAERDEAEFTRSMVELAWDLETRVMGFDAPHLDGGLCGPDDRFDVFVWRTWRGGVSDVIAENDTTETDDRINYLIVDPWGPYGGDALDATVAHELNHAMHAVFDWNESGIFFEMSAQFVEDQVHDDDNAWKEYLADFQQNPEWSIAYYDDYETFYMYGSALYLFYLRDGVFADPGAPPAIDDATFLAQVWRASANPAGENEPDFVDALGPLLGEHGLTFEQSVVEFSAWRWFTGARDDGHHFEEGASLPESASVRTSAMSGLGELAVAEGPMEYGASYVELTPPSECAARVAVRSEAPIRFAVQWIDASGAVSQQMLGDAFTVEGPGVVVVTGLPADPSAFDPDLFDPTRHPFVVEVASGCAL